MLSKTSTSNTACFTYKGFFLGQNNTTERKRRQISIGTILTVRHHAVTKLNRENTSVNMHKKTLLFSNSFHLETNVYAASKASAKLQRLET